MKRSYVCVVFRFLLIFFCGVLALSHGAYASAVTCDADDPKIRVQYSIDRPEYIRSLDYEELTKIHSGKKEAGKVTAGLTGGKAGFTTKTKFNVAQIARKHYCLSLEELRVKLVAEPKIYVAKNFPRGSCEYNAILKHEGQHVKITKKTLKEQTPKYRRYIEKNIDQVRKSTIVTINEITAQKEKLNDEVTHFLQIYMDTVYEDMARRQAEIDTPEEYARIHDKCRKWEEKMNRK